MLEMLMSNPEQVISPDLFMDKIWGCDSEAEQNVVWVYISYLRKKFIVIAMLSVSIVLIAIVGTINIANYISTNQALDARLSLIADNGDIFPDMTPGDSGKNWNLRQISHGQ